MKIGDRYTNKHTGQTQIVTDIQKVPLTANTTIRVVVLNDGSRWGITRLEDHWLQA